jgi:hypothetical protein
VLQLLLNGLQCWHTPGIIRAVAHLQLHCSQLAAVNNRTAARRRLGQKASKAACALTA